MTEVTQDLVPCERPAFAHLRALRDLSTFPEAAEQVLASAQRFFHLNNGAIYSGYARELDFFDSPYANSPEYAIQIWHGDLIYRTVLMATGYAGVLHIQLPANADPKDYLRVDQIQKRCSETQRPGLAPAVIGHIYNGNLLIQVPNVPDDPLSCLA